ncbi:hypothetical protein EON79_11690, partial [bacterium]
RQAGRDGGLAEPVVAPGHHRVAKFERHRVESAALKSNGTVVVWGRNDEGQRNIPDGLDQVFQLSAGGLHTMALKLGNSVVAWGDNGFGQTTIPASLPPVVDIASGDAFNLALLPGGVELDRKSIVAGDPAVGTITLANAPGPGGAVYDLSAEHPTQVHVPATVFVPAGAKTVTFPVTTEAAFHDTLNTHVYAANSGIVYSTQFDLVGNKGTMTLSQTSLVGGSTSSPAVTLTLDSAPYLDLVLDVESNDPAAMPPATVTVPAGQKSVRFTFTHAIVPSSRGCALVVRHRGDLVDGRSFTLRPLTATLTFVPLEVIGGTPTRGFVQLNAAVAQPLAIALSNGDASLIALPASFQIGKGDRAGFFPVTTTLVDRIKYASVTAVVNAKSIVTKVKVIPGPTLTVLTIPTYAYGRQIVNGTIYLREPAPAGGATVTLTKSGSIAVPATVVVPAGQTEADFPITTSDVSMAGNATVTATAGAVSITKTIEVRPIVLSSLTLSSASVTGGTALTGTVTLTNPVQVNTTVALTSQFPGTASVPATVTIPAGSKSVTFAITTSSPGATAKNVKITATKNGTSEYRTLKVNP